MRIQEWRAFSSEDARHSCMLYMEMASAIPDIVKDV